MTTKHEIYNSAKVGVILKYEKTFIDMQGREVTEPMLKISIDNSESFIATKDTISRMFDTICPIVDRIKISLEWDKIDTKLAESMTDEILLEQVKYAKVLSGWGLIAEVCKRLSRKIK